MLTNGSATFTNITAHSSCDQSLETIFRVLNLATGAVTLAGNLLVFVAIVTSSRLRQNPMNQFVASLAITDIMMGACISPGYSLFCVGCWDYALSKYCWIMEGTKDIALASSIFNLLAVSFDRCLAVYRPLRYSTLMTRHRVVFIMSLIWGLSIAIAGIRNFWEHSKTGAESQEMNRRYNVFLLIFVLLIPCIIVTVINVKIILTIRSQARLVLTVRNQPECATSDLSDEQDESQTDIVRKRKGTLACALVVIVFVVSWIPRISFNVQALISGAGGDDTLLHKLSIYFFIVQSSINPIIYSFVRADFRQAVVKLFRRKKN